MSYDLDYFGDDSFEDEEDIWGNDIHCWSCGKGMSYEQHMYNDGFCPHCESEIELDEEDDE